MINKNDITNILKKGENDFVEFKKNFSNNVIISLVAFSNTYGGKVFIGVDDNGRIKGVDIGKESVQKWVNEIKQKTDNRVIPVIQILNIESKKIVVFSVIEYPSKPISFKGKYYKRVENSNHQMNTSEIVNEYLRVRNSSWDMFIDEDCNLTDLDFNKIVKLIERINKNRNLKIEDDPIKFLNKYGLIQGEKITNAAFLLLAKNLKHITEIQIGLFETKTIIKKSLTIKEDLLTEIDLVMDFIMAHITKEYIITGKPERDEKWQYPMSAVREFVVNAIIHRDYRDGVHSQFRVYRNKIELWNSGKLDKDLNINFLYKGNEKSRPRNIKIAEIFKEIGLIEKYGSGISRAIEDFASYGLVRPVIELKSGGILVVLSAFEKNKKVGEKVGKKVGKKVGENISKNQRKILEYIKKDKYISLVELSNKVGMATKNIEVNVSKLKKKEILKRIGPAKGGYWEITIL